MSGRAGPGGSPGAATRVEGAGVTLAARRWSPGRPDPRGHVLLVHGFGEHAGRYGHVAEALTAAGWGVLAYDQRGHGASPGRPGVIDSFDDWVDDLDAVRDGLPSGPDAPPVAVLGHSLGGLVVLRWLQEAAPGRRPPVTAAVLSAPWLATALPVPWWKRAARPILRRLWPRLTVDNGIRAHHLTRDPDLAEAWRRDPAVHGRVSAGLAAEVEAAQRRALSRPSPPGLPLLVLVPGDDPVAASHVTEGWARGTAGDGTELEVLAGRRHEAFNDVGRDRVLELLLGWLEGVRAREHEGPEPGPHDRVSSTNPGDPAPRRGEAGGRPPSANRT